MTNAPDPNAQADTVSARPMFEGSLAAPAAPPESSPSRAQIDREVAEAMAAMDPRDLAELSGGTMRGEGAAPGTELTGTVAGVSDDDVFVEFGPKQQGVVPRLQFGKKEPIEVGRRVDVVVDRFDESTGLLILSRKGAIQRATWTNLAVGHLVEGRVTGVIKGGLELDLKGIRAFMPGSQVDVNPMKDVSILLNQVIRCEVVELDRRNKNVIVSRRRALEKEYAEQRDKLRAELANGQVRHGVVRRITDFGAFVDLGGVDGLLHIRDLSWGTVNKVEDVVHEGQEVDVVILKVDASKDRISLGLKQAQPDPWAGAGNKYTMGESLKARVVRLADFGAFAELEPGIDGLIPISEMSWGRVKSVSEACSIGDMVDVKIIRVELEKRRIALSMKQAQADPWAGVLQSFTPQSVIKGTVKRLTDFGAFVEVAPGIEGLIHISEMSDKRVNTCADVVQVGQEVETRVLGVDAEQRRISLSIKQVKAPAAAFEPGAHAGMPELAPKLQKKRKKPLRGGLTSHFEW